MNAASNSAPNSSRSSSRSVLRPALRLVLAVAIATALVWFGLHAGPSPAARGDEDPPQGQSNPSRDAVVTAFQRTLKAYDDRLIGLARQVLDDQESRRRPVDQLINLRIDEKRAETDYKNAKLEREIAEIAVTEYSKGVFVQDLATVEGELSLAKSGLDRARERVAMAKERQEKIREVADENTAYGRHMNYDYSDRVSLAELQEQQSQFQLEVVQDKKKFLLEYTKPKTMKELESEVKKAHSKELAKEAEWELRKGQIESLQKTAGTSSVPSEVEKRLLGLIERAIPIEEQAHAKLDELARDTKASETLQKEIRDLTNDLGRIVAEAESVKATDDFARLTPRLQQAFRRYGVSKEK